MTLGPPHPNSVGSYRLREFIAVGGQARVYRARHQNEVFAARQGGDVALKLLHSQFAVLPEARLRFEREAALGIELEHPGIVRVFEMIIDGPHLALVMEWAKGTVLSETIGTQTGPIPWDRARPMIAQLIDALKYAHQRNVIHRDLKPENIMLGPDQKLKILDFGIAKGLLESKELTTQGMGSLDYVAPEQWKDARHVDQRADIYALGMTVYEMLAGRLPWDEQADLSTILRFKAPGKLPPPTQIPYRTPDGQTFYPSIPAPISNVVMKALAVAPDARFQRVDDMWEAFKRAENNALAHAKRHAPQPHRPSFVARPHPSSPRNNSVPRTRRRGRPMVSFAALIGIGILFVIAKDAQVKPEPSQPTERSPNTEAPVAIAAKEAPQAGSTRQFTVKGVKFSLAYAPKGEFWMGSSESATHRDADEARYQGRISQGFYIATTEITQSLYTAVTGSNPSKHSCPECPVEQVSWYEAVTFCNALSARLGFMPTAYKVEGKSVSIRPGSNGFRLPSEQEWAYAARANEHIAPSTKALTERACYAEACKTCWFQDDDGTYVPCDPPPTTTPTWVGHLKANAWGLHDMLGNVREWTDDWYAPSLANRHSDAYADTMRTVRGGGFLDLAASTRIPYRYPLDPNAKKPDLGFRIILPE